MRTKTLALAATSLTVLLGVSPALAQNNQNNPCPPGTSGPNCTAAPVETVTVTGTRIPTATTDSASPIQGVTGEEIQLSGTLNLTDYLKRIPALAGSIGDLQESGLNTTQTNAGSSLSGLNLLDLRNLGFDRTLVLEDGQRIVSSSAGDAAVDVNSIPITLIDRVDVVTGGSSAIYGADAVTGAVNFIMKHDLEGLNLRVQGSDPQDGGNSKFIAAASYGHNFDNDNGNFEVTLEETVQNQLTFNDRDFTKTDNAVFFIPNPANPNGTNPNLPANVPAKLGRIYEVSATGAIEGDLSTFPLPQFNGNGSLFNVPNPINGEFSLGGDGLPLAPAFLAGLAPIENRTIAQFTGDERFSNWFKLSGEFRFSHVDTKSITEPAFNEFASITSDNPFLPANVQSAIAGNGTFGAVGPYEVGTLGSYPYLTPGLVMNERVSRDTYRAVLGADGDFPLPEMFHDARYDLHYVYGQTDVDDVVEHNLAIDRYYAALDSVNGPGGPTCRSNLNPAAVPPTTLFGDGLFDEVVGLPSTLFGTTFTPGANSGCVAYNPFVTNSPQDQKATAWMTMDTPTHELLRQQDINGYVSFDFPQFSDWGWTAKPVSFVLGGEWRSEFSKSESDPITRPVPVPGEPGVTQSLFFDAGGQPVEGKFTVTEAFGEVSIPVLAHQPFADELTFDFAGRVSDYSTAGTDETWKLSGIYAPIPDIKFRAADAYAVRAPNIGELFAPLVQGFQGINDPCDPAFINQGTPFRKPNCQALENALLGPGVYTAGTTPVQQSTTLPVLIGGNSGLQPETARTITLGATIQPRFIDNLQLTVDWYRVNIVDAISALSGQTIADQCVDLSTINNSFCAAVTRNGNSASIPGSIKQVIAQEINVSSFYTKGIDFSATYYTDLDDLFHEHVGSLTLHMLGNHMDVLQFTSLAGQAPVNTANVVNGGTDGGPAPFWQVYLDAIWNLDDWTVDYNIQYSDGLLNESRQTLVSEPNIFSSKYLRTAPQDIHSMQVRYQVREGYQVYAGINNLWYQKPDANNQNLGYPADPTGRLFYVGVQINTDPFN